MNKRNERTIIQVHTMRHYNIIRREINGDTETPISLYYKLAHGQPYSFLLESARQDRRMGRFSFIGIHPMEVVECDGSQNPLEQIKKRMANIKIKNPRAHGGFEGGFVGYFTYDTIRFFENIPTIPEKEPKIPESVFMFPQVVIAFDHYRQSLELIYYQASDETDGAAKQRIEKIVGSIKRPVEVPAQARDDEKKIISNVTQSEYENMVKKAKEEINRGEVFQVVLSQNFVKPTRKSPFDLYRTLRRISPSPYMYLMQYEDFAVVGASPETMVRLEGNEILLRPIAGTRKRGISDAEDNILEDELLADEKEVAEHRMLLDLGRSDVGRVAERGSVKVPKEMYVQKFSHVMHLISDVTGRIAKEKDMFDVFRACFPAGTLSGAPKVRACEIIARLENASRGIYGGAVGYFDFSGNMDFAIAIRTIVHKNATAYIQAGAGIVYDSVPANEYQECLNKAESCFEALAH